MRETGPRSREGMSFTGLRLGIAALAVAPRCNHACYGLKQHAGQTFQATLAVRMLRLLLAVFLSGTGGMAAHAAVQPGQVADGASWSKFDQLILSSQKTMMADPRAALQDARAATVIAQHQPSSQRY